MANQPVCSSLLAQANRSLEHPLNAEQEQAFVKSFIERISLLWGPPGTGKTRVLAATSLGWLEDALEAGKTICIGVGSSNWKAIDNLLKEIAELLDRRRALLGEFNTPVNIIRVRGDHSPPPSDSRFVDLSNSSSTAASLADELSNHKRCVIVGGTWAQLGKLAQKISHKRRATAKWFDLLLIDEASQVPVSYAAAYFLLLKDSGNVVLAGDHRQLGPVYTFQMPKKVGRGLYDCIFTYMQDSHGKQTTQLYKNYRSNLEVTGWPERRFYRERYEAVFPKRRLNIRMPDYGGGPPPSWPEQLPWSKQLLDILNPDLPVVVITYPRQPYTLSNPFETQIVTTLAHLYKQILIDNGSWPGADSFCDFHLGIVTPHRAQMSSIRNLLAGCPGMPDNTHLFIDTVDAFQGQERELIISSYTVADPDFVATEDEFILDSRRFNVTLTRTRSKFVMLISKAITQHLPADADVARDAAHLQLFVESYCKHVERNVRLPYYENGIKSYMPCDLKAVVIS